MPQYNKCFICDKKLQGKEITNEHIFLKSLGDNLTSNKIICKECNSKLGSKLDGDFANEFKDFIIFLNLPSRDKKTKLLAKCENDNQEYLLDPRNGWQISLKNPKVNVEKKDKSINITGSFKNKKQAKEIINKIAKRNNISLSKIDYSNLKHKVISKPRMKTNLHLPNYQSNILEFVKMATEYALIHLGNSKHQFDSELTILKMIVELSKKPKILEDINRSYYQLIIQTTNKHTEEKLIPTVVKDINNGHKMKAVLYTHDKELYCAISIIGINIMAFPLALNAKVTLNNEILAYYDGKGNDN